MKTITKTNKGIDLPPATLFLALCGALLFFMPVFTVQQRAENPAADFATKMILLFAIVAIGGWAFFKQPQKKGKQTDSQ